MVAPGGEPCCSVVDLLSWRQKLELLLIGGVTAYGWAHMHAWLAWKLSEFGLPDALTVLICALLYLTTVLATFDSLLGLLLLLRAKKIDPQLAAPKLRVAMIATKVPSEPLSMLQTTLGACLAQDYPHPYDVWLADEDPDEATLQWCTDHGVRVSCRKGVPEYHRQEWPRRTRCKEGNLAYFYDHWGYNEYDVVAQFDADHVPEPTYLTTMLPAFLDDSVGYVALPSICGANEKDAGWSVRMCLFFEGCMHGASGSGMSYGWVPLCIGSHYAVRTAHLQACGGIGPELDEDMSTSLIMSAHGYKGVFALNTFAHGDGPATFEDGMFQEFQWLRSGAVLFLRYIPPYFRRAGWRVRFRMAQIVVSWLLQGCLHAVVQLVLGAAALATTAHSVSYLLPIISPCQPGLLYALQVACGNYLLAAWISANGWMRPVDAPLISWEAILHGLCRPFFMLKGTLYGAYSHFAGATLAIKVTPKGEHGERFLPASYVAPSALCASLSALGGLRSPGWLLLVAPQALVHVVACWALVGLHYRDHHSLRRFPLHNFVQLMCPVGTATALTAAMLWVRGPDMLAFASSYATCSFRALYVLHPYNVAFTAALLVVTAASLCFSRRLVFTPLRTHRRHPADGGLSQHGKPKAVETDDVEMRAQMAKPTETQALGAVNMKRVASRKNIADAA